jgi:hypothetical protein
MIDNVKFVEVGRLFSKGLPFVCVLAVCSDNRLVVKEEHWLIPWEQNTKEAAEYIAGEYGTERWQYQAAWVLVDIDPRPRPLRFLPDLLDKGDHSMV